MISQQKSVVVLPHSFLPVDSVIVVRIVPIRRCFRLLTHCSCKEWFVAEGTFFELFYRSRSLFQSAVLTVISLAAVHWLVALRVIALLGNSALVYWGLFATFLGYLIATVVIFAYNAIDITCESALVRAYVNTDVSSHSFRSSSS